MCLVRRTSKSVMLPRPKCLPSIYPRISSFCIFSSQSIMRRGVVFLDLCSYLFFFLNKMKDNYSSRSTSGTSRVNLCMSAYVTGKLASSCNPPESGSASLPSGPNNAPEPSRALDSPSGLGGYIPALPARSYPLLKLNPITRGRRG